MIKYYCDQCENLIPEDRTHNKHIFTFGKIRVQTIRSVDGTWNAGQVCVDCIREAIAKGSVKQELPGEPSCPECLNPQSVKALI